jgi:outer membrane immunogenic protein
MRKIIAAGIAAACFAPVAAQAQDTVSTTYGASASDAAPANAAGSFGGFRIEGNVGWDKAQAYGRNNEKLGYGGSAGFDGNLTDRIVIGPEVNYWHPNHSQNTVVAPDGGKAQQGRDIWGGAVRIGVRATPDLLVFGKGGYAQQAQRTYFVDVAGNAARSSGHADGYQVGGGFQYAPHDRFSFAPANLYLSGQYVYSNFSNHTVDQHAMAGVGFRFR